MNQLTSSQQALPNIQPSQGLYALLLMSEGVGVRSLSARSFKVRHKMRRYGEIVLSLGEKICTYSRAMLARIKEFCSAKSCAEMRKGQTRLKLIETESTWHLQFEEFLLCRLIITPFECADV